MRNDIQPNLQTVDQYFSKSEFFIPSYQRPYAWQVAQCDQLVEDINQHMENFVEKDQDNYFFGAILIAQESGEEHDVTLIDGQQRTTTFMLLLKALLLKVNEELGRNPSSDVDGKRIVKRLTALKEQIASMLFNLTEDELDDFSDNLFFPDAKNIKYINKSISEKYAKDMETILLGRDFDEIKSNVHQIYRRQKDNRYTNFYKNFRYFYNMCNDLSVLNSINFANHFINYCQVITITSFNTDQAINIFNSLNGTGVPLTPIEVIVSSTTANAADRKTFERNWQEIVKMADDSNLDLNTLMTHYIFTKLSHFNGSDKRNPGIRAFFTKNKHILNDDEVFTSDLKKLLDNYVITFESVLGKVINTLNGNLKPFVSSYLFFRDDLRFLEYLLRMGILIELSELSYSHGLFKGFLEDINLEYSQVSEVTTEDLIMMISEHIKANFEYHDIIQILKESGISNSILYVNEYLFALENNFDLNLDGDIDIEHIMPQSGKNRENIQKDGGFIDASEFREYAEKLGNKILLESDINRGIGDAWFRTKKDNNVTKGHGYIGSKFPIAKCLASYRSDTWTKVDIDVATEKAARRIADFVFER